jgi:cell division protein FtsI (penicillin-binding protein 3)
MMDKNRSSIMLRAYTIYILVLIFAFIIIGKVIYLNTVEREYWSNQASIVNSRTEVINPIRGNIYANDESLLAISVPIFEVRIDLDSSVIPDSIFTKKLDSLALSLSLLFDGNNANKNLYKQNLIKARNAGSRGFLLRKKATYKELKAIKTFPILRKGSKGGLIVYTKDRRERPFKNLASMTIGYERLADYKVDINLKAGKINPDKFVSRVDTLAECLANLFLDYNRDAYKEKLEKAFKAKGPAARITKKMNELQYAELLTFPLIEDDTSKIIRAKKLTRSYFVGLEGHYRTELRGEKGIITLKRVGNNSWKKISEEDMIDPKNGCDLYTAIDVNLQDVAQNALRKSLDTTKADWGCVILMEVKTGYIKAIANLTRNKDGIYQEMRNYATEELYEPGSTFKMATVMAVLEDGTFDTNTIVNTGRALYPGWGTVVDSHEEGYGRVSVAKAFEKSSNVGITEIARRAFGKNPQKFQQLLEKMGLTYKSGIDLDYEPKPSIKVSYGDLLGIAFGYALKLTPLQVLCFYNAVANNGKYMCPTFVKEIKRTGITVKKNEPHVLVEKICSDNTLAKMKKLLEGVVIRGTAKNIRNSVYQIAGKTGTAKIYDPSVGSYIKNYVASFAGYFPADNPMYSCIVVEYNMKGTEVYGAQVAAPVFKEISDKVYATRVDIKSIVSSQPTTFVYPSVQTGYRYETEAVYKGLNLQLVTGGNISEWVCITTDGKKIFENAKVFNQNTIPDVIGMKAKDAVYILETLGLKVIVKGIGKVKTQSVKSGEKILNNKVIVLNLSNS